MFRKSSLILVSLALVFLLALAAGPRAGLVLLVGLGIGALFEACGFGFAGPWRRMILHRDPSGIFAQLLAIGLTAAIAIPLLNPANPELIGAHAPVGFAMILGAFVFGIAMQIVLGCGSGTLVNAGSGNTVALVALPFFAVGSFFGAFHLPAWTSLGTLPLVVFSGTGGLIITLIALGAASALFWILADKTKIRIPKRWLVAALVLSALASLHLLIAGQPWGVVYGLGLWAAKVFTVVGFPVDASAFWSAPAHATRIQNSLLTDVTSLTNIGLIVGAAMVTFWRKPSPPSDLNLDLRAWLTVILAGFALGYASRLAFGCNVGAFFSGISTGSLHGWVWFAAAFAGSFFGIRIRNKIGLG